MAAEVELADDDGAVITIPKSSKQPAPLDEDAVVAASSNDADAEQSVRQIELGRVRTDDRAVAALVDVVMMRRRQRFRLSVSFIGALLFMVDCSVSPLTPPPTPLYDEHIDVSSGGAFVSR